MRRRSESDIQKLIKTETGQDCIVKLEYSIMLMTGIIYISKDNGLFGVTVRDTTKLQTCDDGIFLSLIRPALVKLLGEY